MSLLISEAEHLHKLLATLIIVAAVFTARSQTEADQKSRLDSLRAQGYQSLYNLDYESARRSFREMISLAPEHPAGPQCMAASFWVEQLNESWELKATLYSTKTYSQENKLQDPKRKEEFRNWIRSSRQLSQARLKRDPHDVEALYFLGAAEGLEAAFSAAVERRFMASLRSGSDAVEHHREVLKQNPELRDAELTIGLHNYIVGSLPLPLKLVVGSFGVRGSKKRGLKTLEEVSREGHWARDVALVLLVDLYKREKRWQDAVNVSRSLASRYERNYLFKLQLADALANSELQNRNVVEIADIFERLLKDKTLESSVVELIHFRYGETLLVLGDPNQALNQFQWLLSHRSTEHTMKSMSQLRLAQCFDMVGKRTEALATYRSLLASPSEPDFKNEVKRGIQQPYHWVKSQ